MLLTESIYPMIFFSGLVGGFGHCIGMCGPVVATYSMNLGVSRGEKIAASWMPHLLYNLGRITTYSILGGIMGLSGSFAGVIQPIARFQNIVLGAAGIVMMIMGFLNAGWLPNLRSSGHEGNGRKHFLTSLVSRAVATILEAKSIGAYFPMGLALGFIPCGLLYTALIGAAGAGAAAGNQVTGFFSGMLLLFLFGLGTFPALFLLGGIVSEKGEWLRTRLSKLSAIMMIAIGAVFIYRAMR